MKFLIICIDIFLSCIISFNCYSQEIAIHLSVEWTKKINNDNNRLYTQFKIDSIPELVITYINKTDRDWYMLKAINAENYFPYIGIQWFGGEVIHSDYIESRQPTFNCIVRKQNSDKWKIAGIRFYMDSDYKSNDKIEKFYNNTMRFSLFDFNNSYMFFPNDLVSSAIEKNEKKDFVFLRRGCEYRECFSLIGFYLMGGVYKFFLNKKQFDRSIFTRPQNMDSPKKRKAGAVTFDGMTILLPDVLIDSYLLYTGTYKSDTVYIHLEPPPAQK